MATSNAGYGSNRQDRFTRSDAIRAMRVHPALSLPKVPAFTLSHPLRRAFGY
jgi:hypothetical protein